MSELIATATPDGTVLIELRPEYSEASFGGAVKEFAGVFDKVLESVEVCARAFSNLANRVEAESATVKFGVRLEVKSGHILSLLAADIGSNSMFEVSVTWKRRHDPDAGQV